MMEPAETKRKRLSFHWIAEMKLPHPMTGPREKMPQPHHVVKKRTHPAGSASHQAPSAAFPETDGCGKGPPLLGFQESQRKRNPHKQLEIVFGLEGVPVCAPARLGRTVAVFGVMQFDESPFKRAAGLHVSKVKGESPLLEMLRRTIAPAVEAQRRTRAR